MARKLLVRVCGCACLLLKFVHTTTKKFSFKLGMCNVVRMFETRRDF